MTATEQTEQAGADVARPGGSTLVIAADQDFWTPRQAAALAQIGVQNATNADLGVFFHQCTRTGLDPFLRQIYMIERQGKQTIQTGIDGFRLVARRAVERTGESYEIDDIVWCGKDGQWSDVWLGEGAPSAAKAVVTRGGKRFSAVALFDEFAGRKGDGNLNAMWKSKSAHMIGKCAEALAHRKAFPQDLSGLYTDDEMAHEVIEHIPGESSAAPSTRVTGAEIRARRAPTPDASPEPVDTVVVDSGPPLAEPEPVEVERVETSEPVEPETAPVVDSAPRIPVDRAQLGRLQTAFNVLGCRDKDKRLAVVADLIGRPIVSSNELTSGEAELVMDNLGDLVGAEQFGERFAHLWPAE